MGNTCVGPNLKNGFLQSISTVVWRARTPDDLLPSKEEGQDNSVGGNASNRLQTPSSTSLRVQNKPPELVKIPESHPKQLVDPVKIPESHPKQLDPVKIPESHAKRLFDPIKIPESHAKKQLDPIKIPESHIKQLDHVKTPESHAKQNESVKIPESHPKQLDPVKIPESHAKRLFDPIKIPESHAKKQLDPIKIPESHIKQLDHVKTPESHAKQNESVKIPESHPKQLDPVKIPESHAKRLFDPIKIPESHAKKQLDPIKIPESHIKQLDHVKTPESHAKQNESVKLKKPQHTRRVSSAGLQANLVLQRKTGNLKELYSLGRKLGQGQFGTTHLCVEKTTGKEFACKSITKRKLVTEEDLEDVRREIQIMHHLAGHPNVISIIGAYEDAVAVHVVMELCAGGELFDRIIQRGHYTERKAAELARVIGVVVETCHSLGVMHRDLKPENFLFADHTEEALLKTIDFGLSVFFKPGEVFTDVVGSPYYVAPEVLRKHYGPEADVWSAGVIIFILLSGAPPFWAETEQEIFEQVLHGDLDFSADPWPSISESAKDLVRRMLDRDPKKRITAHEVLCHPWVQVDGVALDKPLDSAVLSRLKQFSAMNKFKKMALRVIAETLSEEEIAGIKEMFKMIDTDNSGQITYEELKAGLERAGANLMESEISALMEAADIDNSGTIDYGEFIAATLHLNKVEKEDHLFAAFSYFDKDGSGYITSDELQQACKEFRITDIELEDMIREADQDDDGRIDYNEFVEMMIKGNAGLGKKGMQNNIGFREALKLS